MPVRALVRQRGVPLPVAIATYKVITRNIKNESARENYLDIITKLEYEYRFTGGTIVDWADYQNDLYFSKTYERLFHCPLDALWIAYESLTMFSIVHPDLKAGDMQYFYYKKHLFVMKCIAKQIYYYTPDGQ